ncbi:MAG TPA: DUF3775 domain-containing protein [Pirellulales bacterium]
MKLSEVVREVIRLGDASREYWDEELPKHHPFYPVIRPGENPTPPPPEDAEILDLLKRLPENQLYSLILLAYVGRGDCSADDLPHAYREMKEIFPSSDLVVANLAGSRALAEYLTDAMEEIRKRHLDLDKLQLATAVAVG